jgi:hypothetical protein
LSVELPPAAISVGFAVIPAVGGPVAAVTVTVACEVAVVPEAPVAMNV